MPSRLTTENERRMRLSGSCWSQNSQECLKLNFGGLDRIRRRGEERTSPTGPLPPGLSGAPKDLGTIEPYEASESAGLYPAAAKLSLVIKLRVPARHARPLKASGPRIWCVYLDHLNPSGILHYQRHLKQSGNLYPSQGLKYL